MNRPRLLLHACCAPCTSYPVVELKRDFNITLAFYGPNIQPEEEYKRRLESVSELARRLRLELIELEYEPDIWFRRIKGLEGEPEGHKRCEICYEVRLARIGQFAEENNYEYFATTLTTSPYKPACIINPIGKRLAREYSVDFLDRDFKKQDGFKKSCKLTKEYGLYRQNYCGCIYSRR